MGRGGRGEGGGEGPCFVEVKTTRHSDHHVFLLSFAEWDFITREPPVRYHIYRVSGVGSAAGVRVTVIEDVLQAVKDGRVRLCLSM